MSPIWITVLGWLVSPVIRWLLPKVLVCLGFHASNKLQDLEVHIIPELKKTLQAVDQERMMQRGKRVPSDVDVLDKMAAMLRHALEDAEDIFDDAQHKIVLRCCHRLYGAFTACIALCKCCCVWIAHVVRIKSARLLHWARADTEDIFYDAQPKIVLRCWHRLCAALAACIALCKSSCVWIARVVRTKSARLLQWARDSSLSLFLLCRSEEPVLVNVSAAVVSDEPVQVTIDILASDGEPDPTTTSDVAYGTVPMTTGAAASDEPDPVTASAAVSDNEAVPETAGAAASVPVTTGAAASDEPDPVTTTTSVVASGDETVLVTADAAASDEPDPVTASAAVSDNEAVPETAGAAASVPVTTGAAASDEPDPVTTTTSVVASGDETVPVTAGAAASDEPDPETTNTEASDETDPETTNTEASDEPDPVTTASNSLSGRRLSCLCSSLDFFKNCCTSLCSWLAHVFEAACFYRDWSYQVVGIKNCQENASLFDILDVFLTAISRLKLKKRMQKVENTVSEVKKSPLLGVASNNTPDDIVNKNRSKIRAANKRKVFGREGLRDDIMARLRETPQGDVPSSSPCYSVIGIYGVAGSGKTTFARYIRDYIKEECKEEKLFDIIMCIHVSETFNVGDIFHEMLKDITEDRHSHISDHEELEEKLKEALRGKHFFLILDDLWVKNKNDPELEELISPLNDGAKGSKILITARTKDAAGALCIDKPIEMPDLDEDQYLKMFMHYALGGTSVAVKEFERVGRLIAKKLHTSPIAAVTVAGRLGTKDIRFWKNTANYEKFNETMDALWWSYQQLDPDIRRCLEYCNIFPRRFNLERGKLVHLWTAQGFVKTSCATEEMEDVAEGYIEELVSCSFLQQKQDYLGREYFTIHDLIHDLLAKVGGNDCFTIENEKSHRGEGWKVEVPQDVRHLFVQNYDGELITEKILKLQNLRTLIIKVVARFTQFEEKVFESICMKLPKLRVLAIGFNIYDGARIIRDKFLVPESIINLKHLRYLALPISLECNVNLPCALAKLLHIQLLDFMRGWIPEFTFPDLINLRHISCLCARFPHIGRLTSLQILPCFAVCNEEGYEIKQLRDLNKLRGKLTICGLENVKSKEEALEANLAAKERLMELKLYFRSWNKQCTAEVEAEVLEGLRPPVGLEQLLIIYYNGSRYPDWMVGRLNGGPKDLQTLDFHHCSQLGPGPELEAFPHLRRLALHDCSWDALPGNLEHLTSLETLEIMGCMNIRSLPTLAQSLKVFNLLHCDGELVKGCQTEGDPNWLKIKHIPEREFFPKISDLISEEDSSDASDLISEEDSSHASEADQ